MITHNDIDIVMNALCGTPMVATAKFADKIQIALAKEIPQSIVPTGNDESDWMCCPRCGAPLCVNEDVYDFFVDCNPVHCYKCGQAVIGNDDKTEALCVK